MTKPEAELEFRETEFPFTVREYEQDGVPDLPARRESWNNWTDAQCKAGRITPHQDNTWAHPRWLETVRSSKFL